MGNAGQANYSSGKAGVTGLTKTLAKEWGQFKVNVNAVAFGFVETRLTQAKEKGETVKAGEGGPEVAIGIPEQMRQHGRDDHPAAAAPRSPRRPPRRCCSSRRRCRTTSTAR